MAWSQIMGAGSVRYHRDTVLDRADDFPGQTLAYYGSRGETPMAWGGAGAARLGLTGTVTHETYGSVFAEGGARDPVLGTRLVSTKRPGLELVVSAHKTVAVLGVVGRADDMHRILDAETDATLAFLDAWESRQGGRRGKREVRTPTSGLIYGRTRHATSRAGDPNPHDHVLVANVVEMLDDIGGWKGLDTAGMRDMVHAATAVGRLHAAWEATRLGYGITPDHGPSGKLDHFAITGIPSEVTRLFSKRSEQIDDDAGPNASYRLRSRLARSNRPDKDDDHTPEQLMDRWHIELAGLGLSPGHVLDCIHSAAPARPPVERLSDQELADLVDWVLSPTGPLAGDKRFGRAEVIRHLAPKLHGRHPDQLDRALSAVLAHPEALPLLGQPGARNRAWVLASTRAAEEAIADCADRLAVSTTAVSVNPDTVTEAIRAKEWDIGARLTADQRDLVAAAATSARQVELVLGVAGAGKTTALDALRAAYQESGYRVLGTATSGQAAKTLGAAAHLDSRTTASLLWRLQHGHETLDSRTVLIIDEAGMVDDPAMLALLTTAEIHGTKTIIVGDYHQLGAVGPGGGLEGLITRHPDAVHTLTTNIRQTDPAERSALEQLRHGDIERAVSFYSEHNRIRPRQDRADALATMVEEWARDVDAGHDTAMFAWRRTDVAALNQLARVNRRAAGLVETTEVEAHGGRRYAVGDQVVALAPDPLRRWVTSQRGTVTTIDPRTRSVSIAFHDTDTPVVLRGEELDSKRLDHAYATTVHRAQGATVDRSHVYADGGGRELTYVALSRARHETTIHCVADDLDQAIEDLHRDWNNDRRQRWTLDTDLPAAPGQSTRPALMRGVDAGLRLGRLRAERDAVLAAMPTDPDPALFELIQEQRALTRHLDELRAGTGRYTNTPIGQAAQDRVAAQAAYDQAARDARSSVLSRRQERKANGLVEKRQTDLDQTRQAWLSTGAPIEQELTAQLAATEDAKTQLGTQRLERATWLLQHPDTLDRLVALNRETRRLELEAGIARPDQPALPIPPPTPRGHDLAM
jgi:conjugative relaxase-like TrwC/TraI family protein